MFAPKGGGGGGRGRGEGGSSSWEDKDEVARLLRRRYGPFVQDAEEMDRLLKLLADVGLFTYYPPPSLPSPFIPAIPPFLFNYLFLQKRK
jgi:hypothetical protein